MLRVLLLVLVIALLVDALLYSGAFTQSIYAFVKTAADQFVALIGDAVDDVNPGR